MSGAEEETHADRKRRVESVVGKIRYNTGGPHQASGMRPGIRIAHIKVNFPYERGATERAVRAAVERGEVVTYTDPEGMTRYAVADAVGLRAVALERGMATVAEAVGVPVLADCAPTADAVGTCIDTHIGEAIAPDDLPLLNALQRGLREAEDG
jgi:hypothetical protein